MTSPFALKLFHPKGCLSPYIQGIWSATVKPSASIEIVKWLQGDVCSGVLFNFGGEVSLDGIQYSNGVIFLPVSTKAHSMALPPGAQLAGIRFHPAIGFSVLEACYEQPALLNIQNQENDFQGLFNQLTQVKGHEARIGVMYRWLKASIALYDLTPSVLLQALRAMKTGQPLHQICRGISLSQRQIERQMKKRVGVTPKEYQRILRVKNTLSFLRKNHKADLASLALEYGFSDQAHMTRECRRIAKITPGEFREIVISDSQLI